MADKLQQPVQVVTLQKMEREACPMCGEDRWFIVAAFVVGGKPQSVRRIAHCPSCGTD